MNSTTSVTTRLLAAFCRVCPLCVGARWWPLSRFAKATKGIERACPACKAYAQMKDATPMESSPNDEFFGRMNDPTASASIKGPCGDQMEFYLVIRDDVIEDVRYYTEGCGNTRACGGAVARRAKGRNVTDALSISAGEVIRSGECEPAAHRHCAILAVSTLYRAIADYLLAP